MRWARIAAVLVLAIGFLPTDASAQRVRRDCKRITKQIVRYDGVVREARARDNVLWEAETLRQIDRLAMRRERLCPQYAAARLAEEERARQIEKTKQFLVAAGKVALKVFTGGAYPF